MTYDELMIELRTGASDPARHAGLRSKHAELIELIGELKKTARKVSKPLPGIEKLTALQISLYDNWKLTGGKPRKNFPHRYKLGFKLWAPERGWFVFSDEPNFSGNAVMMDKEALLEKVVDLQINKKNPLTSEYGEWAVSVAGQFPEDDHLFGLIHTKVHGEGTKYHEYQMTRLRMKGHKVVSGELILGFPHGIEQLPFPPFSQLDSSGNALNAKVHAASRYSVHPSLSKWKT